MWVLYSWMNIQLVTVLMHLFALIPVQPTKVQILCGVVDILFVRQGDVGGGRHSHKLTISWWVNGPRLYFLYSFPAVPCRSKLIAGFGQLYPPCRLSPLKAKVISATNPFINLFSLCCRKGFCRPVMKLASVWFSQQKATRFLHLLLEYWSQGKRISTNWCHVQSEEVKH